MIIGRAAGTTFLPANAFATAEASTFAHPTELPKNCNQFLGTKKSAHLAGSILGELGRETDPAALAMACFEEVAKF